MVDRSIHTMKEKMNNFSGTITVNGTDEHLKDVPSNIVIKEHIHSHDDLQNGQTSELTLPEKQMETLKDLYNQEYFDDEDDEDSDWEPVQRFVSKKWFCTNCTMPNFDDVNCCDICGEHKNSGILLHGCFASPTGGVIIDSDKLDVTVKCKDAEKLEGRTAICFDERMLLHSEVEMKSIPHPERPDRLRVIASSLSYAGIYPGKCLLIPPREVTEDELHLVHSLDHIQAVNCTSHLLASYFTSDTYANEHSARAARLAAGFCSDLAISVLTGKARNGFALIRPPGHHAGVKQAMGFCLHNNAAVAAKAAQAAGAKKVLIVDWDVHHGNGTQEIFDGDNTVLYISLHRHENGRFYPGTGAAEEVGIMEGMGYSVNIPWKTGGVGDDDYLFAFQHIVLPIATEFAPDLTIISSGFDAARGDPLGCCDVTPAGYAQMTNMLSSLSGGKLLAILEGGYNLRSISSSSLAVVKVLLGEVPKKDPNDVVPTKGCLQTVIEVLRIHSEYWPVLKGSCASIQSKWGLAACCSTNQVNRKRDFGPIWWKWGSKSLAYRLLYGGGLKRVRKEV